MSIRVDADFPGGNIIVESLQSTAPGVWQVRLRQDWSTSSEWWFYWRFRVQGAAGQRVRFEFADGDVFTSRGPCYSADGENWQWPGADAVRNNAFEWSFAEQEEAHFCLAIPYLEADLNRFLAAHSTLKREVLAISESGREVELLCLPSPHKKYFVPVVARSHACESLANFVVEGLMDFWIDGDESQSNFLRENVDLYVVPFLDKDGVEAGEQGKLRIPHDHNRDYTAQPIYASTKALMQNLHSWPGQLVGALDVHCPWIRGGINEKLATVGIPYPAQARLDRYMQMVQDTQQGTLHFAGDCTPHGYEWNQGSGHSFSRYIYENFPTALMCAWEIPYAVAGEMTMSAAGASEFGRDVARALAVYLEGRN
jgi:hypothetical protein